MKVLFLAPDITLRIGMNGGAGTHMRASIEELKKRGFLVNPVIGGDIIGNFDTTPTVNEIKFNYKKIFKKILPNELRKTINDYKIRFFNKKMKNYILKNIDISEYDIIYERSGYGYDVGTYISKVFKKPHILETDVIMLDLKKHYTSKIFNKIIYRRMEKRKYHNASSIVVQSEYSVKFCKNYWKLNHDRIYNKDLGVNIISKKEELKSTTSIKNNLKIKGKKIIGFVGYFMPYQNIDLLLKVAVDFKKNEDVIFLFVGGGRLLEKFKEFKVKNNLDNVIFTGVVDKSLVSKYYDIIDIAVIPNCAFHMYPVKFLEYSANNLPVAIPKYEVFKEFYEDEKSFNKFTFLPNDQKSLHTRLDELIKNIDQLNSLTNYTFEYVKKNKTWANSGFKLEYIINKTLNFENSPHK